MYPDLVDLADLNATTQHRGFARCASADAAYVGAKTPWVSNSCQAGIAKSCLRFGEEGTDSSTFSFWGDTTDSYVVKFNENDIVQTTLEVPPEKSISPMRRNMLFFLACLHILLASGEVYGWTALRPVLINSGMFDAYNETTRVPLMTTVATWGMAGNALSKLPVGIVLDKWGPRVTSVLGATMFIAGCLLFALCDRNDVTLPVIGFALLGMAGPALTLPCFQFCELYGNRKASALAYLMTSFEISSGVFLIFEQLNIHAGLGRRELFLGYASVGVFLLATAVLFWPDDSHSARRSAPAPAHNAEASVAPRLVEQPLRRQLCSAPFVYLTLFLAMHNFRHGFLLSTLGRQIETFFADPAQAQGLLALFNTVLPLGFTPMMLFTATGASDYLITNPLVGFVVVNVLCITYGLMLLAPSSGAYAALFFLFPLATQLVFCLYFSFAAETFGYASFGRIAGIASLFAGALQLAGNTALVDAVNGGLLAPGRAAADNWRSVDLFLGLAPLSLFLYPLAALGARRRAATPADGKQLDLEGGAADASVRSGAPVDAGSLMADLVLMAVGADPRGREPTEAPPSSWRSVAGDDAYLAPTRSFSW